MNTIKGRAIPAIFCALALTLFGCSKKDTPAAPPAPTVAVQGQKATEAEFANPGGLAVDAAGNLYVTDGHAIRKITPDGMVTAFAGQPGTEGNADGKAEAATFATPAYLATDSAGNVYVADSGNHNVRVITSGGVVTTQAKVDTPTGLATDSAGNLYVSDPYQGTKKYPAQGAAQAAGAQGAGVSLAGGNLDIGGIATDGAGNIYLVNQARSVITKVKPDGKPSILAGSPGLNGSDDGQGQAAHFRKPTGIAVDSAGNVFVADTGNHVIRKITPAGAVTTLAGKAGETGYADGAGDAARFDAPRGLAVDKGGNVYVTDQHKTIRKITPAGMVSTFAGRSPLAPIPAAAVSLGDPHWLATDRAGNLYISDLNVPGIRKIAPGGAASSVGDAGTTIGGLATDSAGNVYFTNYQTNVLSRIDPSGAVTALASGLDQPFCVAVDGAGNLYVAADQNATIRKITRDGTATIFAGTPGQKGWADGSGQAARFSSPRGLATDSAGNLYVTDMENYVIRKITPAGVVTTLAGHAGQSGHVDAAGDAARFDRPIGLAIDGAGNLYVSDFGGNTIRKVTPAGVVSTLAGSPMSGSNDGPGSEARFNGPLGLATDSAGNVYVADSHNRTIRKITPDGVVSTIAGTPADTSAEEPAEDNSEPEGYDHKDDSMPSGDEAPADDSPK